MKHFYYLLLVCVLFSCNNEPKETKDYSESTRNIAIDYAKGFTIKSYKDFFLVTLNNPWRGQETKYIYLLYKNEIPEGFDDAFKIKIPIKNIACMSLTHIAFIDAIKETESIVAVSGLNFTHNEKVKQLSEESKLFEIGSENAIDYELLVDKSPQVVMTYGINENSLKYYNKLEKMGLQPVLNAEYMETHPLGKAEWIKFVAAFYDKLNVADSVFSAIEGQYLSLVKITDTITNKPSVFVGMPWNGSWYVAGGESFQAQLFKDAGAHYLWNNNEEKSSVVISKEAVLDEAFETDFWLNQNSYESINSIIDYDDRLRNLKSIKDGSLYNNIRRQNKNGGNDYWESATIKPNVVLKDLIEIFHPELLEHELYYYEKLK